MLFPNTKLERFTAFVIQSTTLLPLSCPYYNSVIAIAVLTITSSMTQYQTCQPPRIGRGNPRIPCIPRIHSRMQNLPRLLSCCSQDFFARRGGFSCKFKPKWMQKFGHDEIIPSNICDRFFFKFELFRCGMPPWRYINRAGRDGDC